MENAQEIESLAGVASRLFRHQPLRVFSLLILNIVLAFSEGLSLLLVLPLLGSIGVVTELGGSTLFAHYLSRFFNQLQLPQSLPAILLVYVVITGVYLGLHYSRALLAADVQLRYVSDLQNDLFSDLLKTRWSYFCRKRSADFLHAHTSEIGQLGALSRSLINFFASVSITCIYILFSCLVSLTMTAFAVLTGVAFYFLVRVLIQRSRQFGAEYAAHEANFYSQIHSTITGMKGLRSHGREASALNSFSSTVESMRRVAQNVARSMAQVTGITQLGAVLALCLFVFVAVELLHLPSSLLVLLVLVFARLSTKLSSLQTEYQQIIELLPVFGRVLRLKQELVEAREQLGKTDSAIPFTSKVELQNVTFSYEATSAPVLQNFNLKLQIGTCTALTGASGAGKTTVLDLVVGLLKPEQGAVLIDQTPLDKETIAQWRQQIGYVWQEAPLFHDTIRQTLQWAHPGATDAEMEEALRIAQATELASSPANRYDVAIGERGSLLSGGERQRLAIARAIVAKPKLLILDEATSALDEAIEQKILQELKNMCPEVTILVVTHRQTALLGIADATHCLDTLDRSYPNSATS